MSDTLLLAVLSSTPCQTFKNGAKTKPHDEVPPAAFLIKASRMIYSRGTSQSNTFVPVGTCVRLSGTKRSMMSSVAVTPGP